MKKKHVLIGIIAIATTIFSCKKENKEPTAASSLFYTVYSDSIIGKIDLKNGNAISNFSKGIASGLNRGSLLGLALNTNTGEIYATNEQTNGPIYKINTNGIATILYDGANADRPAGIAYSSSTNKVYWSNRGDGKMYSISASGGTPTQMFVGFDDADGYSVKVDDKNGKIYFANFDEIFIGNIDGSGTPTVLYSDKNDTLEAPSSIELDVDNNKIYWSDEFADVVASANLDGTGNIKILFNNTTHGVDRSDGLAIDFVSKKIYWTETDGVGRIRVGNLDGSGTPITLNSGFEAYNLLLK
ncbi:MAG TPA: hypothetical protein PK628_02285 [Chitinophagales bacterium]|nr:hypothetical protein [Chitinophagales bacterium]